MSGLAVLLILYSAALSPQPAAEFYVNVQKFGAKADARQVDDIWVGTDNAATFNACAAYCRKNGLTMYIPRGNYGVASTVWLTNPDLDGIRQAPMSVRGSNQGAYSRQEYSANICALKNFKAGSLVSVRKKGGRVVQEPDLVPILGISNGRQVHVEGIGILGGDYQALICGAAIGNISQMTSFRYCSFYGTYAGVVFPGIRPAAGESVIEGNNDLLVVEQCYLRNVYNIVCAGTEPYNCEYRNNTMQCLQSVFSGNLITSESGYSGGSHRFSTNLFATFEHSPERDTVYFDLSVNALIVDAGHFETGWIRKNAEVLLRANPEGKAGKRSERIIFTNNLVNLASSYENPDKYKPLFDTWAGSRMLLQGNHIKIRTPFRLKADGAVLIGNCFECLGPNNQGIQKEKHFLLGSSGKIQSGLYDINHFIRKQSDLEISLPDGTVLKKGQDFRLYPEKNAFEITEKGKEVIDRAKTNLVLLSYTANDAAGIHFQSWGGNQQTSPHGWKSRNITLIGNKVVYKTDDGIGAERELTSADLGE
jgi:hypothetical protein